MGDLNSYAQEDSIDAIKAGADDVAGTNDDYTNLIAKFHGPFAYSYTFDGQAGYLDHALAGSTLVGQVTGAADWHINSDEPDILDYDTTFKPAAQEALYEPNAFRTSDHDPVMVGLDLVNAAPSADAGGPYQVIEGDSVTLTATGTDPEGTAVTFAWDLDGNGSFETPGRSVIFSSTGITAPATRTVRVRVTDGFGHTTVDSAIVSVLYNFEGFFKPLRNLPTTNSVKAGQAVPVRFSLNGNHGLAIFAAGSPRVEFVSCSTLVTQSIEPATSAGGLSYKASSDQYTYPWTTDRAWAGRCAFLRVTFNDGTTRSALFKFTK
jgi:hypothetical protein